MYWANFLSMHLAETKSDDTVRRVADNAYRPLLAILRENPTARLTLNLSSSLARRLARLGGQDILDGLVERVQAGQVELTGSAANNTILNLLPPEQIRSLIEEHSAVLRELLGEAYQPRGFFPPDMAYSREVADTVRALGFHWILIDEMGHSGKPGTVRHDRRYALRAGESLRIFFRDRSLSTGLSYGAFKTGEQLIAAARDLNGNLAGEAYFVTGNEAELYGHHRRNGDQILRALCQAPIAQRRISDLLDLDLPIEVVEPLRSTWSQWEVLQF